MRKLEFPESLMTEKSVTRWGWNCKFSDALGFLVAECHTVRLNTQHATPRALHGPTCPVVSCVRAPQLTTAQYMAPHHTTACHSMIHTTPCHMTCRVTFLTESSLSHPHVSFLTYLPKHITLRGIVLDPRDRWSSLSAGANPVFQQRTHTSVGTA